MTLVPVVGEIGADTGSDEATKGCRVGTVDTSNAGTVSFCVSVFNVVGIAGDNPVCPVLLVEGVVGGVAF